MLDHVNGMLATEGPKIDRISDQLIALSQHADDTIQNVNGTVTDVREPIRKDLAELQTTLQQAKGRARRRGQSVSGMYPLLYPR